MDTKTQETKEEKEKRFLADHRVRMHSLIPNTTGFTHDSPIGLLGRALRYIEEVQKDRDIHRDDWQSVCNTNSTLRDEARVLEKKHAEVIAKKDKLILKLTTELHGDDDE